MKHQILTLPLLLMMILFVSAEGQGESTQRANNDDQQLEAALAAFAGSDYAQAYGLLRPLAEAGRSEAQLMLGVLYERGYAVELDVITAYSWYLRALRLHNPQAQESLDRLGASLGTPQIARARSLAEEQRMILDKGYGCASVFGEAFSSHYVTAVQPHATIDSMVEDILSHTGLSKNFLIRAANVANAAAVVQGSDRYVLYNPSFINAVDDRSGSPWAVYSIMAHEIGHHLQGHTIVPGGSRPPIELEADRFSGFVLAKMGAMLDDAQAAMANLASASGSSTHPARDRRLAAIAEGWRAATGQEARVGSRPSPSRGAASSSRRVPSSAPPPLPPATPPPAPVFQIARVCSTAFGSCQMMVPVPVGSVCYCVTPNGNLPGYAR